MSHQRGLEFEIAAKSALVKCRVMGVNSYVQVIFHYSYVSMVSLCLYGLL